MYEVSVRPQHLLPVVHKPGKEVEVLGPAPRLDFDAPASVVLCNEPTGLQDLMGDPARDALYVEDIHLDWPENVFEGISYRCALPEGLFRAQSRIQDDCYVDIAIPRECLARP